LEIISNSGNQRLGEILRRKLTPESKLSIIASCFTIFAFGELKTELEQIKELRFIFSEPTFIKKTDANLDIANNTAYDAPPGAGGKSHKYVLAIVERYESRTVHLCKQG
jgi:hypothetical protein